MSRTKFARTISAMLVAAATVMALPSCSDPQQEPSSAMDASAPSGPAERWKGAAGGWELSVEVQSTEIGGTRFQSGTVATNKPGCLPTGDVEGNTNGKQGVTWVMSGKEDTTLSFEGVRSGDTIQGTLESRSGAVACTLGRTPLSLRRIP